MKKIILQLLTIMLAISGVFSQHREIKGKVNEMDEQGYTHPLPFVNVYWKGTTEGTVTNEKGEFTIHQHDENNNMLIISYVGYLNDTMEINPGQGELNIIMASSRELDEVVITERLSGSYISKLKPLKTEVITAAGLQKLPCCNLSESFENSATVDVGYADAVTGAKHIKMLGLAGVYSQMLFENIPYLRGMESAFGLNYVPGPWMQSIQVSKGAASVINGYESTTGQINIEYKKPDNSDPLFVNLFANRLGRMEANLTSAVNISDRWSTMLLGHASTMQNKIDRNKDSFLDNPLTRQYNFMNRWKYNPGGNLRGQIGFAVMDEARKGGQLDFNYNEPVETQSAYGMNISTRKYRAFGKIGYLIPEKVYNSIGFQTSLTWYEQDAYFGTSNYAGGQLSFYSNLMYQGIINNTNHKLTTGISFQYDRFDEVYNDQVFDRTESVPGTFGQYTYTWPEKFNGILGLRSDYHSMYGLLITPRIHMRYSPNHHTTFRASAGKGYRSASVLAENMGVLVSSRTVFFPEKFDMEQAWNYGLNFTRHIHIAGREMLEISLDAYRTDFVNRIIMDIDQDVSGVYFYNLDGKSYSSSFQVQAGIEPVERFDVTVAYRYNDVKATYDGELMEAPLTSKYKGLLSVSYATRFNKWMFDLTGQLNGQTRLPDTRMNPIEYQRDEYAAAFFILHAQVSKRFRHFDIYAGGENLTDFRQEDPIIAPDDPFGEYFDGSMVWGPLLGRRLYVGVRINIE
jgi:outer membrane receptor for ferrienterochelin and colicins